MLNIVGSTNAPQLVLIHGGGVGAWMWDDCLQFLTPYYQLIIVSLPYHEQQVTTSSPFTIQFYAQQLVEQLHAIRNQHPIGVVGFSLGAQISLELLTLAPNFFSFAMINSALCTKMNMSFSIIRLLAKVTMPLAKVKSFARLQASMLYIPEHLFEAYYQLSSTMTHHQLAEILHTNMSYELKPAIKQCTSTVFVSYGEKEKSAIKKSALIIQSYLPSTEVYVVKGIGHGFPLAEPENFAGFIRMHFTI